ncbi:unnamed protein product [Danaus chrysippus]|uniref:(African queen) hypothetical protein n=1 Tax=Danaus chrysippus TaxID=151541 RepID=A0A8J2QRK3_9NEOP|nr:unnamed protein product [Danaus chrysippus]
MILKSCVVLCCVLVCVLGDEKYTDKYDNINLQEILDNKKLLHAYVNCILDKGKCSPEGKELKAHVQDALETGCEKCTDKQMEGTTTMIDHLVKHERAIWKELTDKFDPKGVWRKKYEDRAREKGIVIPED